MVDASPQRRQSPPLEEAAEGGFVTSSRPTLLEEPCGAHILDRTSCGDRDDGGAVERLCRAPCRELVAPRALAEEVGPRVDRLPQRSPARSSSAVSRRASRAGRGGNVCRPRSSGGSKALVARVDRTRGLCSAALTASTTPGWYAPAVGDPRRAALGSMSLVSWMSRPRSSATARYELTGHLAR
jgi:hypothetical protein